MNLRAVLYLLGRLLLALSVALLVPAAVAWYEGEGLNAFLASAAIAGSCCCIRTTWRRTASGKATAWT